MKVLIISSGNSGEINVCVKDQAKSLFKMGITTEHYLIVGKGILGYLKNLRLFKNNIKNFGPDLIHAHYGLSGILVTFSNQIEAHFLMMFILFIAIINSFKFRNDQMISL